MQTIKIQAIVRHSGSAEMEMQLSGLVHTVISSLSLQGVAFIIPQCIIKLNTA